MRSGSWRANPAAEDASIGGGRGAAPRRRATVKQGKRGHRIASFGELGGLRETLRAAQAERRRVEAHRVLEERRLDREARVFEEAMRDVVPLSGSDRAHPDRPKPPPRALQLERDERAALSESLSDEWDVEQLLETDETLSYRHGCLGPDVLRKLRRGHWVMQRQLDLHGLRVDQAREALIAFIQDCVRRDQRCVRVIHGKGLGSAFREPVLRDKVRRWLVQRDEVLAFCEARPIDGGSGAVMVLLRTGKSR
ncbi:MAG: Smr/MutS family protein [Burkholderiales bacterium]|nr:MAG: Smr/MutS family protein [Burkholderiales bacterium]